MANDVADILDRAADLIEPEGTWTKDVYARDASGKAVDPLDPGAACWCAVGAIRKAGGFHDDVAARPAMMAVKKVIPRSKHDYLHEWNDARTRTHAQVVGKLREAAEIARAAQVQSC